MPITTFTDEYNVQYIHMYPMDKTDLYEVIEALENNKVTSIDLRRVVDMNVEQLNRLTEALEKNRSLERLQFPLKNMWLYCSEYIKPFITAIFSHKTLNILNLSSNHSYCYIPGYFDNKCLELIKEVLDDNYVYHKESYITELYLTKIEISDYNMKNISYIILNLPYLNKLYLNCNTIKNEGLKYISEVLKEHKNLTYLNLSENVNLSRGYHSPIDGLKYINKIDGIKVLSEALKVNTTLTELSLIECNLIDEGIKCLSEALKLNSTLTCLNLKGDLIHSDGIKSISDVLQVNTTLTDLSLTYLYDDLEYLTNVLRNNSTLTRLDLNHLYHCNNFSLACKTNKNLADMLRKNTTLTILDL